MKFSKHLMIGLGSELLYRTRLHRLLGAGAGNVGCILMLHRVLPEDQRTAASLSRELAVSAPFLRAVIEQLLVQGFKFVSLGEAQRRLEGRQFEEKFVCITFDDGYRDNYQYGYAICREYAVPMHVFVCTGFVNLTHPMWWLGLETLVSQRDRINLEIDDKAIALDNRSVADREKSFRLLLDLFGKSSPGEQYALTDQLAERHEIDLRSINRAGPLTWDMIQEMHAGGLVSFGAHTVSHARLSRMQESDAAREIRESSEELARRLGATVDSFAYPFGRRADCGEREFELCRLMGHRVAVTTEHGVLGPCDHERILHLPRLSLNGRHESMRMIEVMIGGATTALARRAGLSRLAAKQAQVGRVVVDRC